MRRIIRICDLFLFAVCFVIFVIIGVADKTLPDAITMYTDSNSIARVFTVSEEKNVHSVDYQPAAPHRETLKLFDTVPVKSVTVKKTKAPSVYVSGEIFGIKLYTDGVIVVGTQSVDVGDGKKVNPAEDAGIMSGDIITAINDVPVFSSYEVTSVLNDNNAKPYNITLKREGRYKNFRLMPVYSPREGCYKAGMWVRDSTAGIGTMTFYNEKYGTFASLGHPVNDIDTNELMPLLEGEAVRADITGIQRASSGNTGALSCSFEDRSIGILLDNTDSGLYGSYTQINENSRIYEIASKQEVKKGKAQLISSVEENTARAYDVEIIRVSYNRGAEQKDIVFRVTDKKLLKLTGGIVQGMSGSPIIQNGKLIGAVTHVIINNPEKGYGVFAETMYNKSSEY